MPTAFDRRQSEYGRLVVFNGISTFVGQIFFILTDYEYNLYVISL